MSIRTTMSLGQARHVAEQCNDGKGLTFMRMTIEEALVVLWDAEPKDVPQPAEPNSPLSTAARVRWDYVITDQRNMRERIEKLEEHARQVDKALGRYL